MVVKFQLPRLKVLDLEPRDHRVTVSMAKEKHKEMFRNETVHGLKYERGKNLPGK